MNKNGNGQVERVYDDEREFARDLAARIAAGDRAAEDEAYRRYNGKLRRAVAGLAGCEADIDDWVSLAWLTALPKLRQGCLQKPGSLGSFLGAVARKVALGELRKCGWLSTSGDHVYLNQAVHDPDTPYDVLLREQLVAQTAALILRLPVRRDRDVIEARFLEGRDTDCLCDDYGMTRIQLTRVISRARGRLRDSALAREDTFLSA